MVLSRRVTGDNNLAFWNHLTEQAWKHVCEKKGRGLVDETNELWPIQQTTRFNYCPLPELHLAVAVAAAATRSFFLLAAKPRKPHKRRRKKKESSTKEQKIGTSTNIPPHIIHHAFSSSPRRQHPSNVHFPIPHQTLRPLRLPHLPRLLSALPSPRRKAVSPPLPGEAQRGRAVPRHAQADPVARPAHRGAAQEVLRHAARVWKSDRRGRHAGDDAREHGRVSGGGV